jgi:hypothetical protein
MNRAATEPSTGTLRRVISSSLLAVLIVAIACAIFLVFGDRSKTEQMMSERVVVIQCYEEARQVLNVSANEKEKAEAACRKMKEDFMGKWKRYKF